MQNKNLATPLQDENMLTSSYSSFTWLPMTKTMFLTLNNACPMIDMNGMYNSYHMVGFFCIRRLPMYDYEQM